MTEQQFERLLNVLERIADDLLDISTCATSLSECVDVVEHENGDVTRVLNIWKEGESE